MHFFLRTRLLYPLSIHKIFVSNLGGLVRQIRGLGGNSHIHVGPFNTLRSLCISVVLSPLTWLLPPLRQKKTVGTPNGLHWRYWILYPSPLSIRANEHMTLTTCHENIFKPFVKNKENTCYQLCYIQILGGSTENPFPRFIKALFLAHNAIQQIQTCLINKQRACDEKTWQLAHV